MAGVMVQSEARRHYVLVAFDCGPEYNGRTFVEEEAATFHLLTNGSLRGSFPGQNVSAVQCRCGTAPSTASSSAPCQTSATPTPTTAPTPAPPPSATTARAAPSPSARPS